MKNSFSKKDYISIFTIFLSVFIFYYARNGFVDISSLLWAEDGQVFLSEVYSVGISSIFDPYAGYYHLYPRLVSLLVYFTDISLAPIIFLIAFLIPMFMLVTVTYRFICSLGMSDILASLITLTAFFVPLTNEIYLNLTNIQWYTFILLFLVIIYEDSRSFLPKYIFYPFFAIFSLTGPFSIYLSCVIVVKIFLDKFRLKLDDIILYSIVFISSIIQVSMILLNERMENGISNELISYIVFIRKVLTFGSNQLVVYIISAIFFIVFFVCIYKYVYKHLKVEKDRLFNYFLYINLCVLIYVLSLLLSLDISEYGAIGGGSRYFFPINYFIILLIPIIAKRRVIKFLLSLILIFWIAMFITSRAKDSATLYYFDYIKTEFPFYEFVKFAKVEKDIIIPINSIYDIKLNVDIHNDERKLEPLIFNLNTQINVNQDETIDIYELASTNCSNAEDIGIKFYISSPSSIKEEEENMAVVVITLLNKSNEKELSLKPHRFTDKHQYPIMVDEKQQPMVLDKEQDIMIYPVALDINEYNNLIVRTTNAPVMIDKFELFCLD